MTTELLTVKELAQRIKRSPRYVRQMRKNGFPMPGGTATLDEARDWLWEHPVQFRRTIPASVPKRS